MSGQTTPDEACEGATTGAIRCRTAALARCRRLFTAAMDKPMTDAVSAAESPSTSLREEHVPVRRVQLGDGLIQGGSQASGLERLVWASLERSHLPGLQVRF